MYWFGVPGFQYFNKVVMRFIMQSGLKTYTLGLDIVLSLASVSSCLPSIFFPTLPLKTESNSQWIDLSFIYHLRCLQINFSKPVADRLLS